MAPVSSLTFSFFDRIVRLRRERAHLNWRLAILTTDGTLENLESRRLDRSSVHIDVYVHVHEGEERVRVSDRQELEARGMDSKINNTLDL